MNVNEKLPAPYLNPGTGLHFRVGPHFGFSRVAGLQFLGAEKKGLRM